MRLAKQNSPWAFATGEPFRVIASLELLAILVGVIVFDLLGGGSDGRVEVTAFTDNRGNGHLMEKLLTTRMPLALVLIELVAQLQRRRLELNLAWVPTEHNEEADALTNEDFRGFAPSLRIPCPPSTLSRRFLLLHDIIPFLSDFRSTTEALKEARKAAPRAVLAPRKRVPLRLADPW